MKKNLFLRIVFYVAGLLILALGIILNTKSGLGVSPIISVAYSITTIGGFNFGNITFLLYSAFVVVEIVLHIFRNHRYSGEAGGAIAPAAHRDLKLVLVMDLLQLPLSLVFTRFMNLFSALLPTPSDNMPSRLLVLAAGIILTGIGAAMSLNMRIIPNPGDGIVQAISDCIGKSVGFTKNCFDLFNICLTTSIGLLFAHKLIGIGLGTCDRCTWRRPCYRGLQSPFYEQNDSCRRRGVLISTAIRQLFYFTSSPTAPGTLHRSAPTVLPVHQSQIWLCGFCGEKNACPG